MIAATIEQFDNLIHLYRSPGYIYMKVAFRKAVFALGRFRYVSYGFASPLSWFTVRSKQRIARNKSGCIDRLHCKCYALVLFLTSRTASLKAKTWQFPRTRIKRFLGMTSVKVYRSSRTVGPWLLTIELWVGGVDDLSIKDSPTAISLCLRLLQTPNRGCRKAVSLSFWLKVGYLSGWFPRNTLSKCQIHNIPSTIVGTQNDHLYIFQLHIHILSHVLKCC